MNHSTESTRLTLEKYLRHSMRVSTKSMSPLDDFTANLNADQDSFFSNIMLTISGVDMRFAMVLRHPSGLNGIALYGYLKGLSANTQSNDDAISFFREMANQVCGEIKRHLSSQFEYLGMSTPLELSATTFLSSLENRKCIAKSECYLAKDGKPVLGVSAFLYANPQLVLHFDHTSTTEAVTSGELEFF